MTTPKSRTKALARAALFCAVTAILAQIAIPMPAGVPVTLQTFAVALCGYCLGASLGTMSITGYLLLGLCGVPVFSALRGGIGVMFGVTGGFLLGFLPFALICGLALRLSSTPARIAVGLLGLAVCHLFGVLQYCALSGTPLAAGFALVSLPYLLKDALSVGAAYLFSVALRRRLSLGGGR